MRLHLVLSAIWKADVHVAEKSRLCRAVVVMQLLPRQAQQHMVPADADVVEDAISLGDFEDMLDFAEGPFQGEALHFPDEGLAACSWWRSFGIPFGPLL